MSRVEIGRHLATDTRVCGGRLIFKGTRILVSDVLELLRADLTPEQIAREYQGLISPEAIHEAYTFNRKGIVREILPKTKTAA
jgi:uncharacterized protein (DUF433 family)